LTAEQLSGAGESDEGQVSGININSTDMKATRALRPDDNPDDPDPKSRAEGR